MAFSDVFNAAYSLKQDLQTVLKRNVDKLMYADCVFLFDVITKSSTTAEKRLMIDPVVVREAYDRIEIAQLAFLRTNWNLADALTKVCHNTYLESILTTGIIVHPVPQWVVSRHVLAQKKGRVSKRPAANRCDEHGGRINVIRITWSRATGFDSASQYAPSL
jgi:hypothetical protein